MSKDSEPPSSQSEIQTIGWGRLFGLLHRHWVLLVASSAAGLLAIAASFAQPRIVGRAVDALIAGDTQAIGGFALAIAALGLARGLTQAARRSLSGRVGLGIEADLRDRISRHILVLPPSAFIRLPPGQLVARATSDARAVRFFLGFGLLFISLQLITIVVAAATILTTSPLLAVAVLAIIPPMAVGAKRMGKQTHELAGQSQQELGELANFVEEHARGIRITKAFGREEEQDRRFSLKIDRQLEASLALAKVRARFSPMLSFLPQAGLAVTVSLGGWEVSQGRITIGELVAFIQYFGMLIWPLRSLTWLLTLAQRGKASAERIFEILDTEPGAGVLDGSSLMLSPASAGRGLRANSLVVVRESRRVLDGVSFSVDPGETLAFVGRTGSGKTTLAFLLPRFEDPDGGSIYLDGTDLRELSLAEVRRSVVLTGGDPFLFSGSIRENIVLGRQVTQERFDSVVALAGVDEFANDLRDGYLTSIGERGLTLSGGQRQRVGLARALLEDPPVLVLDEPFSFLDFATEQDLRDRLRQARTGRTTVVLTNRASLAAWADNVVVLDDGHAICVGTHQQLLADEPLYGEALGIQGSPEAALGQARL